MKIDKYKKLRNGKYELIMENGEGIQLYEDTILKYNLLLTKSIDINNKDLIKFDKKCEIYYTALKNIKTRLKSKMELKEFLIKKEYPTDCIDDILKKLEKQGYINDLFYAKSFLNNKLITTSNGPRKIRLELQKKGIPQDIIDDVLEEYSDDIQLEKINKIANRIIKSNRNKSNKALKIKLNNDLYLEGFSKKLIDQVINDLKFASEDDIAKKEYEKLRKRHSRKYSGEELEIKIKQKMYQKGFCYK